MLVLTNNLTLKNGGKRRGEGELAGALEMFMCAIVAHKLVRAGTKACPTLEMQCFKAATSIQLVKNNERHVRSLRRP